MDRICATYRRYETCTGKGEEVSWETCVDSRIILEVVLKLRYIGSVWLRI